MNPYNRLANGMGDYDEIVGEYILEVRWSSPSDAPAREAPRCDTCGRTFEGIAQLIDHISPPGGLMRGCR